jgi:hypothetical protein
MKCLAEAGSCPSRASREARHLIVAAPPLPAPRRPGALAVAEYGLSARRIRGRVRPGKANKFAVSGSKSLREREHSRLGDSFCEGVGYWEC